MGNPGRAGATEEGTMCWFNPQMDLDRKGEGVEGNNKKKVPEERCALWEGRWLRVHIV